ncbi:MAG: TlpA family protein disulfide reductase [Candidatus Marinimicrobia bacterium]|nr:TlpA family protein disulfide reductase [Candidatus Neomarinimicrobiota bacterium]
MRHLILIMIYYTTLSGYLPEKAPEWVLQNTKGENVALYDLKGKVVIIDFWAIWCTTCKPELIELSELQTELQQNDFTVVGIGVDSGDIDFLAKFKALLGLNFQLLSGNRRIVKRILRDYGNIRRIPSMIIIDKEGKIVHRITGFKHREELKDLIKPLL